MKVYTLFFLLLISCNNFKNEIPFTKQNEYIELDMTDEKFNTDTLYNKIYSLIESRIDEKPLNDTLPFSLKTNDTYENVVSTIKLLDLNFKIIPNNINSKKQISINSVLSEYFIESILTFHNDSLKNINQHISVNGEAILPNYKILTAIVNSEMPYEDIIKILKKEAYISQEEKYFSIEGLIYKLLDLKVNIKIDDYLKIFKKKYNDPNYCLQNKYKHYKNNISETEWEPNYYTNRYFWLKDGVLIDFNRNFDKSKISNSLLSGNYFGNITSTPEIPFKDSHFLIADITYSSTKDYIDFVKKNKLEYLQKRKEIYEERKRELEKRGPVDKNEWNKKTGL